MERSRIAELLNFDDLHVLVLGDVMLDEYITGSADRVSPEAPVPVVTMENREYRLGGAGNVALNTSSLGARTTLVGLVGDDRNGEILNGLLKERENLRALIVEDQGRKTTCKTRILAANQHLLRVDNEDTYDVVDGIVTKVEKMLKYVHQERAVDVIILQDYNKGFFSQKMIKMIMDWAGKNKVPTALDPKTQRVRLFKGVDFFKPNLKEVRAFLGRDVEMNMDALREAGALILGELASEVLLLTLSGDGVFIMDDEQVHWESTSVQSIVDVSGAGDTVISVAALLYAKGGVGLNDIAYLANLGGAAVCRLPGVAVVDNDMIMSVIENVKMNKNVSGTI